MKKILSFLLLTLMTVTLFSASVLADEEKLEMDAFVTISDENGELVLAKEPVHVTDADGDGVLTVHDALYMAHEVHCKGGYATDDPYGDLLITKLWGVEDRAYGCFNNGGKVWRLTEYLADDDHIQAFIYTDSEHMTDMFSYFSKEDLTFADGKETLTLYAYVITEDNNLLSKPVQGAVITVNGEKTGIKTDKNGKFTISADDLAWGEKNVISAYSAKQNIVPPILSLDTATITLEKPAPSSMLILVIVVVVLAVGMFVFRVLWKKYHR